MTYFAISLHLLLALALHVHHMLSNSARTTSDFNLDGDYLLGGLFDIHWAGGTVLHRPEAIDCSSKELDLANYRKLQVMRYTVEEINNSTVLLPNVSLGYEILDHCSPLYNFPGVLDLISFNGSIRFSWEASDYKPLGKVIGVVGPFTSADSLAIAPLFTLKLIPLVSYGAASSALSVNAKYPAFLRTVSSNQDLVDLIIRVLGHFDWTWIAVLYTSDAYGTDGAELCIRDMAATDICLAYIAVLDEKTNFTKVLHQLESQGISVIILFAYNIYALRLVEEAVVQNISDKVWIGTDSWIFSSTLSNRSAIEGIGTIITLSEKAASIPAFDDFIKYKKQKKRAHTVGHFACNQGCDCDTLTAEKLLAEDSSYNFQVYTATYALAHALHGVLRCDSGACLRNTTVYPYMVLDELKKTNLTIQNMNIQFKPNGEFKYPTMTVFVWTKGGVKVAGSYVSAYALLSINSSKIPWHTNGTIPVSICSPECPAGHAKRPDGIHKCCFTCEICKSGTYLNITENPYGCLSCPETEWSLAGSTSCIMRSVMYIPSSDPTAILILGGATAMAAISLAIAVVFAVNYDTPVVKSAGGLMCFVILGCLGLSTISVFFYFDRPTTASCILRYLPFVFFYTGCLACFVVRSFQIVCVFKMAAKFPKLHTLWMKYNGQWLLIAVPVFAQAVLLTIGYGAKPPHPYNETTLFPQKIILGCGQGNLPLFALSILLLSSLVVLCFAFSYMGKDLPKNYNEAKAITFCLMLLILTWVIFITELTMYHGEYIQTFNALAVLSSLYSILLWYFLPKCYIILFQPQKNTQQYFQSLIQSYTKQLSTQ